MTIVRVTGSEKNGKLKLEEEKEGHAVWAVVFLLEMIINMLALHVDSSVDTCTQTVLNGISE